ncbi:MAG: hypothetical protein QW273_01150 [Candidatus Pacearchaeota archaeon]
MKKETALSFVIFLFLLDIVGASSTNVSSYVFIPNLAPILNKEIPYFVLQKNTPLLNAFNLNDYFFDPNNDTLSFNYSLVSNVTIIISEKGEVSFFPHLNFIGNVNVTFFASDGEFVTPSNDVLLYIGTDTEPPRWSNPLKSIEEIYQNSLVDFSAQWTDNLALDKYVFSINQGDGWKNYSAKNFSGTYNTSFEEKVQIIAPAGTNVSWKFTAWDKGGNFNVTDVQSFIVLSKTIPTEKKEEKRETIFDRVYREIFKEKKESFLDFSYEPLFLVVDLYVGESTTKFLKITNIGQETLFFNIFQEGLEKFLLIKNSSFSLNPNEMKMVPLEFFAKNYSSPNQYFGFVVINSSKRLEKVPVVLNLNKRESFFEINVSIPEKYKIVKRGGNISANISINCNTKNISSFLLYYSIKDFNGNTLAFEEENISSEILSFTRTLKVPEEITSGIYLFYARASFEDSFSFDADYFEVGERFLLFSYIKSFSLILLLLLLFLTMIFLIYLYNQKRKREKVLRLYLLLNQLKKLINENKIDEAASLFLRIKTIYGERINKDLLKDKELIKKEIETLAQKIEIKNEISSKENSEKSEEIKEEKKKEEDEKNQQEPKGEDEKN